MRQLRNRGLALLLGAACLIWAPELAAAKKKAEKVDLNNASQQELEALPGVGAATAKKIIAGRPYKSVSDLEKAGVSEKTIGAIKPLVTVGKAPKAEGAKPAAAAAAMEKQSPAKEAKESRKEEKSAQQASAGSIDLNTASQKELEALPGVGAATARKIVAGRPYSSVADLSRAGVPARTIEKIRPLVAVSGKPSGEAASASSASAPAPAAAPAPTARKSGAPAPAVSSAEPAQPPPAKGMVWVNTETKVFHREGDRWYGKTKHGKYLTEADAIAAGYRESKEKTKAK